MKTFSSVFNQVQRKEVKEELHLCMQALLVEGDILVVKKQEN